LCGKAHYEKGQTGKAPVAQGKKTCLGI